MLGAVHSSIYCPTAECWLRHYVSSKLHTTSFLEHTCGWSDCLVLFSEDSPKLIAAFSLFSVTFHGRLPML